MWDTTWHKAHTISSGLTPALLTASGLYHPPGPEPEPSPEPASMPTETGAQPAEAPTPAPGLSAASQPDATHVAEGAAAGLAREQSAAGQASSPSHLGQEGSGKAAVPAPEVGAPLPEMCTADVCICCLQSRWPYIHARGLSLHMQCESCLALHVQAQLLHVAYSSVPA